MNGSINAHAPSVSEGNREGVPGIESPAARRILLGGGIPRRTKHRRHSNVHRHHPVADSAWCRPGPAPAVPGRWDIVPNRQRLVASRNLALAHSTDRRRPQALGGMVFSHAASAASATTLTFSAGPDRPTEEW